MIIKNKIIYIAICVLIIFVVYQIVFKKDSFDTELIKEDITYSVEAIFQQKLSWQVNENKVLTSSFKIDGLQVFYEISDQSITYTSVMLLKDSSQLNHPCIALASYIPKDYIKKVFDKIISNKEVEFQYQIHKNFYIKSYDEEVENFQIKKVCKLFYG